MALALCCRQARSCAWYKDEPTMRILLIEPDVILARTYKEALKADGHEVDIQMSAQAAIIQADAVLPDLVIVELQLVSHSGIEFLYEFRSYTDWQHVPIIVLTNVPPAEFADNWQPLREGLGVRVYHYKPHTTLAQLQRSVREI